LIFGGGNELVHIKVLYGETIEKTFKLTVEIVSEERGGMDWDGRAACQSCDSTKEIQAMGA
jgi:hypothetical protein